MTNETWFIYSIWNTITKRNRKRIWNWFCNFKIIFWLLISVSGFSYKTNDTDSLWNELIGFKTNGDWRWTSYKTQKLPNNSEIVLHG
jgi:hypothetical protein